LTPSSSCPVSASSGTGFSVSGAAIQPSRPSYVVVLVPLGDETIYDLDLGDQLFQTRQPPSLRLPIGQRVPVRLDRSRLRIYDKRTEQAII